MPRLLAACDDPALVLMQDAGTGASVAERLLGDGPDMAAVGRWAETLARAQVATLGMGTDFRDRLTALAAVVKQNDGRDACRARFGPAAARRLVALKDARSQSMAAGSPRSRSAPL